MKFKNLLNPGQSYSHFTTEKVTHHPYYNLSMYQLFHSTGAKYVHISTPNPHNVFGIGFTTPPTNNHGTFHILEHCTLSGSKKFPVHDPFMHMLRRSLSSYMNALTGSDMTFYPFQTENLKDYHNLQSVYLDAVFFPNLNHAHFLQEGWNLTPYKTFKNGQTSSAVKFGGVVFNEMKGVYSDPDRLLVLAVLQNLLPESPYSFDSGGIPLQIPNLRYIDLKEAHTKYYSPSNATFFSYGDFDVKQTLEKTHNLALKNFSAITGDKKFPNKIITQQNKNGNNNSNSQIRVIECAPEAVMADSKKCIRSVVAFKCCSVSDEQECFNLSILSRLLLEGMNTDLFKNLVEKGLGSSFSAMTGYYTDCVDTIFAVGLNNMTEKDAQRLYIALEKILENVKRKGIEKSKLEAIFHKIEMEDRHVSSSFGLNLGNVVMKRIAQGLDELERIFDTRKKIRCLKKELERNPELFSDMIEKYFIGGNNVQKTHVIMRPSSQYTQNLLNEENTLLSAIENRSQIAADHSKILFANSAKQPSSDILPTLQVPEDICLKLSPSNLGPTDYRGIYKSTQPTNGIAYFDLVFDIRKCVPSYLHGILPVFCEYFTQFATQKLSSRKLEELIDLKSHGIKARCSVIKSPHSNKEFKEYLIIDSAALYVNVKEMLSLINEILSSPSFEDEQKFKTILSEAISSQNESLQSDCLTLARIKASSLLSEYGRKLEFYDGMSQISILSKLLTSPESVLGLKSKFSKIAECLWANKPEKIFVSAEKGLELADFDEELIKNGNNNGFKNGIGEELINNGNNGFKNGIGEELKENGFKKNGGQFFCVVPSIQCNYITVSLNTVPFEHQDSAALQVLGHVLQWGYLHKKIREEGNAYGSGAFQSQGEFNFWSYRDPHLKFTLQSIASAIEWATKGEFSAELVKESILATIAAQSRPISPSRKDYSEFLRGITPEMRLENKSQVCKITKEDLVRVAKKYLMKERDNINELRGSENCAIVAFGRKETSEPLSKMGWTIISDYSK